MWHHLLVLRLPLDDRFGYVDDPVDDDLARVGATQIEEVDGELTRHMLGDRLHLTIFRHRLSHDAGVGERYNDDGACQIARVQIGYAGAGAEMTLEDAREGHSILAVLTTIGGRNGFRLFAQASSCG